MTVQELKKAIAPAKDTDAIAIRVFINGQYMATCSIFDTWAAVADDTLVLDADLEIFPMEKK